MTIYISKEKILADEATYVNVNRDPFRPGRRLLKSAMRGLFWGSLVPFTGLLAVSTGIMVYFAGLWLLGVRGREPALLACLAGGTVLLLGVAVQWYVMTTRIRRPLLLLDLLICIWVRMFIFG